jgi:hypothetical protein
MPITVEVKSRVMGNTAEDLDPILLHVFEERIPLSELIARTVAEQISQLQAQRRLDAARIAAMLNRQYLTDVDIQVQAEHGSVKLPGKAGTVPVINVPHEVRKALDAFAAGTFLVYCGGRQLTRLDEELDFQAQTTVTFLRVTPLIGG